MSSAMEQLAQQRRRFEEPSEAEIEKSSRVWVESGPGGAQWELVSGERRQSIGERMRRSLRTGRKVLR